MKKLSLLCLLATLFLMSSAYAAEPPLYAVITPMPSEGKPILAQITDKKIIQKNGIIYVLGNLDGKRVVFTNLGMGKINAAVVVSQLITNFHPKAVILSGIAGAVNPKMKVGDVIIGQQLYHVEHNFVLLQQSTNEDDLNPINHKVTPANFDVSPALLRKAKELHQPKTFKIVFGKIGTSDYLPEPKFTVNQLEQDKADAIEMEGAAVADVCWLYNTPCVIIRSISNDRASTVASAEDAKKFKLSKHDKDLAINNAAYIAITLLKYLPNE